MKSIILVSHGELANGVLSSLEMIAGSQPQVAAVTMPPTGDNLQFERDLKEKMKSLSGETVIIADLLGGTPGNVALKLYQEDPQVEIITGLSLPVVLEAVMNSQRPAADILKEAKAGMVDLKASLEENTVAAPTKEEDLSRYQEFAGNAQIVNTRIDERLIHGQVAGIWSSSLGTQRIIVANDEAAADSLQKNSLRMAAPQAMRLSVLPVAEAAKNIEAGKYGKQKIFLLFKNPTDVKRYLDAGGKLETLNVGNISHKEGTHEVTKSIYITDAEKQVFEAIDAAGVTITAQLVPNDPAIDFIKKMKG